LAYLMKPSKSSPSSQLGPAYKIIYINQNITISLENKSVLNLCTSYDMLFVLPHSSTATPWANTLCHLAKCTTHITDEFLCGILKRPGYRDLTSGD
jgi:hypothetical protein